VKDNVKMLPPEEKLLRAIFGERLEDPRCRSEVNGVTLKQAIEAALSTLTPRQIDIIRTRFGFDDPLGKRRTLEDTGVPARQATRLLRGSLSPVWRAGTSLPLSCRPTVLMT